MWSDWETVIQEFSLFIIDTNSTEEKNKFSNFSELSSSDVNKLITLQLILKLICFIQQKSIFISSSCGNCFRFKLYHTVSQ